MTCLVKYFPASVLANSFRPHLQAMLGNNRGPLLTLSVCYGWFLTLPILHGVSRETFRGYGAARGGQLFLKWDG